MVKRNNGKKDFRRRSEYSLTIEVESCQHLPREILAIFPAKNMGTVDENDRKGMVNEAMNRQNYNLRETAQGGWDAPASKGKGGGKHF